MSILKAIVSALLLPFVCHGQTFSGVTISGNLFRSGTFAYGPNSDYGWYVTSWSHDTHQEVVDAIGSATNTSTQWEYFLGSYTNINTNCWAYGHWDFSCMGIDRSAARFQIAITSNYCITCAHSPPTVNDKIYFYTASGGTVTDSVASTLSSNAFGDIMIVGLSSPLPSTVKLPYLLPANFRNYDLNQCYGNWTLTGPTYPYGLCSNHPVSLTVFWLRSNTQEMNVCDYYAPTNTSPGGQVNELLGCGSGNYYNASIPFTDNSTSGGDSGDPCFMSVGHNLVFISCNYASGSYGGPNASDALSFVTNNIGSDQVQYVNLGVYTIY